MMRLSGLSRSNINNDIQLLLRKWKEFSTGASVSKNAAEVLLNLLRETTQVASFSSSSPLDAASKDGISSSWPATSAGSTELLALDSPARVLFGEPRNSALIWKTLRRNRVPWRETCALMPPQLAVLSAHQREYIERRGRNRPWSFSRLVLESWGLADPDLVDVFRRLRGCRTVVGFAQEVSAALRGRPWLRQVLPVPADVLGHIYQLGMGPAPGSREGDPTKCPLSASEEALLTLELCKKLALTGLELLPVSTREQLVIDYARLHAHGGQWGQALATVRSSRVVRLSKKVNFAQYVRDRSLWAKADLAAREAPRAVIAAPDWRQALEVLNRFPDHDDAQLDFLSRSDVILGSSESFSWSECLSIFSKITPAKQTYGVLRKSILDRLPRKCAKFIVLMAHALEHVGPRMYAGTLIRRLEMLKKKGSWAEAIALACGAKCYDLALNLTPHLPIPNMYELPVDLITYEKDVLALSGVHSVRDASSRVYPHITNPNQTPVDVNQLTYPQLLARALYGDWRSVLHAPAALSDSRLRSLLAAKRITEDQRNDVGRVECHLFSNVDITQLVLSCASAQDLQYFLKVLPPSISTALKRTLPLPLIDSNVISPFHAYRNFLDSPAKLVTIEDCHALCDLIVNYLRTDATQGSCNRETLLLRELARCGAQGRIQLASSETYGLALAFLRACKNLKCRPESSTACKAFTMIPSPKLDVNFSAMSVGVNALNLSGKWETAASVYARWRRKQCEGALPDPPSRQRMANPLIPDRREELADVFARIVYYAPPHQRAGWARKIWKEQRTKFSILLQELIVGDTREVSRILQETTTLLRQGEDDYHGTKKHISIRTKEALILEKKKLLGASFCTLHTEATLRYIVRASGKERVEPGDLDEHGFQRLLKVLPGHIAAEAIFSLHEQNSETVEDHWLMLAMANPDVSAEQLTRLRAVRPYSAVVSSVYTLALGVLEKNPTAALKGLLRLVMISENSPSQRSLYATLAKFMQHMCESADLVCAFKAATNAEENQRLARAVYNRLLENACFVQTLKHDRKSLTTLLKNPEALSPLLLLGYLHHVLNRFLQRPVKASFSSYMLRITATDTQDWMTAVYFFKCIRSPTRAERCLVVRASRGCPDAVRYFVGSRRFLQGCPEQVVVWCDEGIDPAEKWRASLRLFEAAARASVGEESPTTSAAEKACDLEKLGDENANATDSDVSESILQGLISKWTDVDCVRALELLRRAGFVRWKAEMGPEGTNPRPPPSENCGERTDDGNELHVVQMIRTQQRRCLASSASD